MKVINFFLLIIKWILLTIIGVVISWFFLIILFLLVACFYQVDKNISNQNPYNKAIGKLFIIQKDMYLYEFSSHEKGLFIGDVKSNKSFFYNIPHDVEEKYIGLKNSSITLKGIAYKGTVFKIASIVQRKSINGDLYTYKICLTSGSFANQEINSYSIMNTFYNPPYTPTWSDPPIFDAEYALPLESNGIWWK